MSVRRKADQKAEVPSFGALYGPAIDFLGGNKSSKPEGIGMKLINDNDNKSEAFFDVHMYFGPIAQDTTVVTQPEFDGQKYLRFKLSMIASLADRKMFADTINKNIQKPNLELLLQKYDVKAAHYNVYVCGQPANSFYVLYFKFPSGFDDDDFTLDVKTMANSIANVDPGITFSIGNDTFSYQVDENVNVMRVQREK